MYDMDENFNFYQVVMAQQPAAATEQTEKPLESLLQQIADKALADRIRAALKDPQ